MYIKNEFNSYLNEYFQPSLILENHLGLSTLTHLQDKNRQIRKNEHIKTFTIIDSNISQENDDGIHPLEWRTPETIDANYKNNI